MLKLADFFHLRELDLLVEEIVADASGLTVVAGLDPRPQAVSGSDTLLPSGRGSIFRILIREQLARDPLSHGVVVAADREAVRVPREMQRRVQVITVPSPDLYADRVDQALRRAPDVLVVDRLGPDSTVPALEAAGQGVRVLSQIDTVFRGAALVRHLHEYGASEALLKHLAWVIAVVRLERLCPHCKRPAPPKPEYVATLRQRYPVLLDPVLGGAEQDGYEIDNSTFYVADGCPTCGQTGRRGDIAAFDVFRVDPESSYLFKQPSRLPLEAYMLRLAAHGELPLHDVLFVDTDQLRRTYHLLTSSEQALAQANASLERKVAELENANRVLQQRTEALMSLQELSRTLITTNDLHELADRICTHVSVLCGADRAILYVHRPPDTVEVQAVFGWDAALLHQRLPVAEVLRDGEQAVPAVFHGYPPGVAPRHPDVEGGDLRAGLRVPLVADHQLLGVMIVQSIRKHRFAPGDVAMLQAFANQAALAIQRADLVERLRIKIAYLEAAQEGLAQRERMVRELELARQVQQSVMPHVFPPVPGFAFAACYEPARQVGGDFYDLFQLDDHHFGLVIADVSDKGMPAALYMALTRSLLFAEARRDRSPRNVLCSVNRLLLELGQPHMFVTVFYGVVDVATRRLTYARAGHDYPLLMRDGAIHELDGSGMLLGVVPSEQLRLDEQQVDLLPGDRLVLYTDGLTDVQNGERALYGLDRLKRTLLAARERTPEQMCTELFALLNAYQGAAEQFDDMTLLVVAVER